MSALATLNLEQVNVFGLDPFLVLAALTAGSGAVGWLLGPFVGNAVFGVAHRRVGGQIAEVSFASLYVCVFGWVGWLFVGGVFFLEGRVLMSGVCDG